MKVTLNNNIVLTETQLEKRRGVYLQEHECLFGET